MEHKGQRCCGRRKGTAWTKATSNNKEIKPVALEVSRKYNPTETCWKDLGLLCKHFLGLAICNQQAAMKSKMKIVIVRYFQPEKPIIPTMITTIWIQETTTKLHFNYDRLSVQKVSNDILQGFSCHNFTHWYIERKPQYDMQNFLNSA